MLERFFCRFGGADEEAECEEVRWWDMRDAEGDLLLRIESKERLCASVRLLRSVARNAAVTSGEGGSPKMKNLMNAPMRITIESWPRRRPCVKESLRVEV